ncbi:hypothetical protein [Pseudophaeobacter sp.]|uniref:hypothetical protein n=1 Tax=Pseudophaeobacter sp. TaxID=1971739 RepID=UPI00329A35EE
MHIFEAPRAHLDPTAQRMKHAVEARGIDTVIKIVQREDGLQAWLTFEIGAQEFFYAFSVLRLRSKGDQDTIGPNINHEAMLLISDKHAAKMHFFEKGFSVPKGFYFRRRNIKQAYASFSAFQGPVCVKPNNGLAGLCVNTDITDEKWFNFALDQVAQSYPNIVVEESVRGEHFRFFYVAPNIVAIRHVRLADVIGDGASTLLDLIKTKIESRRQRGLTSEPPFKIDQEMREYLDRTGHSFQDVPFKGKRIQLRGVVGTARGSESDVVWDEVHSSYREIVEKACLATPGLVFSGVDVVVANPRVSATNQNYWILEMNASPVTTFFYYSQNGRSVDVAGHVVDLLINTYS